MEENVMKRLRACSEDEGGSAEENEAEEDAREDGRQEQL